MCKVIYSGTFDPITNGHLDIIARASKIFNYVIVAVAESKAKKTMFNLEDRVKMVNSSISNYKNVEVKSFNDLLVNFANRENISTVIRGLRAVSDFEYELQMGYANSSLDKDIDTMYFMPTLENAFISSSVVRELIKFDGNFELLVPKEILEELQ